ncbi:MAG: ATP-binding protein [Tabrizicola sp.]
MLPAREPDPRTEDLHLVFLATPASVRDNLACMLAAPPLSLLSDDARGTAELVLAEVLNNIAEHAYAQGAGPVEVTLSPGPFGIECQVIDQGVAMPGERLPEGRLPGGPDLALDDLPEGGFGWHLIRTLTEELTYRRSGGCNRLHFRLPKAG